MKTTIRKSFLDIAKEEEWLNEQGENGLMLTGYRSGEYEFEDVSPAKYAYKIDIPNYSGAKKKDYFAFLEESGISVVAEFGGRVYYRKNQADGRLDLYTENMEINKQMKKRYSHFIMIGINQFLLGFLFLVNMFNYIETKDAPFWILAVFGTVLIVSGVVFFTIGIAKKRKNSIPKEDTDLME